MQKIAIHKASDLSHDLRRAAEALLGQALEEDETVVLRASKGYIVSEGLTGDAREQAFRRLFERIDKTAKRADGVPEEEIDAAIDEAVDYVRHHRE
jgi:hypothetical protein